MAEADELVEGKNTPNCYRCHDAITPGQASRRRQEVRRIVSSDGKRETHYSNELICRDCMKKARNRIVGLVILGAFAVFGFGFGMYELSFARSPETSTAYQSPARSPETSTVYQNPDFPCVRAINPTVTDSECLSAIARRH